MASRRVKRPRGEQPQSQAPLDDSANLAAALRARLDATPPFWADVAARFGVSGADPCLCSLGRELAGSLRAVQEVAEASRQRLEALRTTLHAAIDARVDELLARVVAAEAAKASALERELERLDAALEHTRREYAEALVALDSTTLRGLTATRAADLAARLDGVDVLLAALPHGPVEPSLLRLELDEGALLSLLRSAGTLLAPRGVRGTDIIVRGLPSFARRGCTLRFELALSDEYPSRAPAELEAAATSIVFHARATACLEAVGGEQEAVAVSIATGAGSASAAGAAACPGSGGGGGSTAVTLAIPVGADVGSHVVISCIKMAGQPVPGGGQTFPVRLRVVAGMHAPLRLDHASCHTPVVTRDGILYAPRFLDRVVRIFGADGVARPKLPLAPMGLTYVCAAFDASTDTLLLGGSNSSEAASKLIAIDASTRAVRWSAALGTLDNTCGSVSVLPIQGVAVASVDGEGLVVYRLSDGARVACLVDTEGYEGYQVSAADPASASVYVSTRDENGGYFVSESHWDGAKLNAKGKIADAGTSIAGCDYWRPLAVVPPAPGLHASYLVVGMAGLPDLDILSLPDCRLVHTHELEGMEVVGLAADPSGTALVVCDRLSDALHVLPWPLPGMPPLQ